ncbi:uncharacterized protein LOC116288482 isoform X2 [Actinia tenebrosa]|nr:uncharacterized protein LOC116288482 isoform X2 [Actinia tenebrosa]
MLDITLCEPSPASRGLFPLTDGKDFAAKASAILGIEVLESAQPTTPVGSLSKEPQAKRVRRETRQESAEQSVEPRNDLPVSPSASPPTALTHLSEVETADQQIPDQLSTFLKFAIKGDVTTKVLTSSLTAPRAEYELRGVDHVFVKQLKEQMLNNPVPGQKPLIVVVKGLHRIEDFKAENIDSYELEVVIGGNHRRVAMAELNEEYQDLYRLKSVDAILFTEMPTNAAIKLAQAHNNMDQFSHELTSQDKIKLCRKVLASSFADNRSEWRSYCVDLFQSSKDKMDYVFFLSSLSSDAYGLLLEVIQKYEDYALNDQKQSTAQNKKNIKNKSKPDLIASRFKPLRGLKEEDLIEVLSLLANNKLSIKEAGSMSVEIKTLYTARDNFLRISGISSWDEATRRFPEFTTKETLLSFNYKKGRSDEKFTHFIQTILQDEEMNTQGKQRDSTSPVFITSDPLDLSPDSLGNDFHGVQLIVVHYNEEWGNKDVTLLLKKLIGLNARKGMTDFSVIIFGRSVEEMETVVSSVQCSHAQNLYIVLKTIPQEKDRMTPAVEKAAVLLFGKPKIKKNNVVILEEGGNAANEASDGLASLKSSVMELGNKAGELLRIAKEKKWQLFVITKNAERIATLKANSLQMRA